MMYERRRGIQNTVKMITSEELIHDHHDVQIEDSFHELTWELFGFFAVLKKYLLWNEIDYFQQVDGKYYEILTEFLCTRQRRDSMRLTKIRETLEM